MRYFDYSKKWEKLLTPEIVALLTQIHEYKGEQPLFIEAKADTLTQLVEIAKIQSTEASNKIERPSTEQQRHHHFPDHTEKRQGRLVVK